MNVGMSGSSAWANDRFIMQSKTALKEEAEALLITLYSAACEIKLCPYLHMLEPHERSHQSSLRGDLPEVPNSKEFRGENELLKAVLTESDKHFALKISVWIL